jgi:hypothetical protein
MYAELLTLPGDGFGRIKLHYSGGHRDSNPNDFEAHFENTIESQRAVIDHSASMTNWTPPSPLRQVRKE